MFIIRRDGPQSAESDLSRSSWMNTWCAIGSSRPSRPSRFHSRKTCSFLSTNSEAPKAPKGGPTISRSSLSRPSKGDTWCVIRLPAFSPIAISKRKKQLLHIPDARSDESVQDLGPAAASGEFRTVRFEGRVAPD
jgi:hypothetical protein